MDAPWRALPQAGPGRPAHRAEPQGARPLPQPVRPRAVVLHRLRGGHPVRQAPALRDRLRLEPGALRGLHARGAVPRLQGGPAQARVARRAHRRPLHRRGLRAGHRRRRPVLRRRRLHRRASGRSPSGSSRRSTPGSASSSTSASTTSASTGRPARSPAARPSASGSPPRSAPGLVGVLYVLDEPSIGLHQRDNHRLIETLTRLRDLGNTLIVVEHDEDTIATADWVVDIGPGAGEHGGQVVHSGTVADLLTHPDSITGKYLSGRREIPTPGGAPAAGAGPRGRRRRRHRAQPRQGHRRLPARQPRRRHRGVRARASRTLVNDILYNVLANKLNGARHVPGRHKTVTGLEHLDKVVHVDQSPIGRTPRSNPATYTGVFDHIRKLFADDRGGEDPRLPAGPVLLQRQGRPLRRVLRRRHHQDRDELPPRRLRARARSATARATTARPSRCTSRARRSPTSSTCRSRRPPTSSPPCRRSPGT